MPKKVEVLPVEKKMTKLHLRWFSYVRRRQVDKI